MEPFYALLLLLLATMAIILEFGSGPPAASPSASNAAFRSFRNNYLLVFSLAMGRA